MEALNLQTSCRVWNGLREHLRKDQEAVLSQHCTYCVELAAGLCWAHVLYAFGIPNKLAVIFHEEQEQRVRGLRLMQKIWDAVAEAEKIVTGQQEATASVRASLKQCLKDMSWNVTQVAREVLSVCSSGGWSPDNEEIRKLGFAMWGRPASTKHHLEDVFSHLSAVSKRQNKNLVMNRLGLLKKQGNQPDNFELNCWHPYGGDMAIFRENP